ncbi:MULTISPECIES: DUF3037 domain-containing protein [Acinetobacter]|uniref:DUF3037 domain-containing protein n=1 Tax=Acinetobacter TaxID=469 RepID=UPI0002B9CF74|nr:MULTISPECIES: DUF3037 domain-containing protein [Acinetobacter]MBR8607081.1 DUF3037 domain-containing protein [Acinetobacter baumannii]MDH2477765.1 DUF3037 domain-containing protein [Acinetobacter baumannii]MDS7945682.1 DUF3037 domain-containing protein [Acinetobacter sp. V110_1]MDV4225896.1 DUF3037 domain-containing protein [Acinetobacter baumannii]MDV4327814.1 DUF3037 domain-containing protein [Acinetobacter baumannii]
MSKLHIVKTQNSKILRGEWSLIQWNPDIATEELLNIGVALNINGKINFKMLDRFERLSCLFDDNVIQHVQDIIELSLPAFENNCRKFSEQIKWIDKGLAKGNSEQEILDRLYNRVITLAKECNKKSTRSDFKTIQSDALINRITKKFRDKMKDNPLLSGVIPNQKYIAFNDDSLLVPLRGSKGYGGIVSTVTPNLDRISSNYLMNVNDLKTAAILNNKEPTFFILSPSDAELNKLDSDKAEKIDNLIESLNRKQEQQGIKIECESSELILLDKIQYWAEKAA